MKKAVFPVTTAFLLTAARLISADLPSGGQVAAGTAAISSAGNALTVTQTSAKAVINWQDFSVGAGKAVRFDQPDASSVTLNRVVGTSASLIDGALSANGRVFLVNPNGVLFGAGAQVEVGGLVASTLALRDADFLAGNYVFDGAGAGIVANHGRIVAVGDGQGGFITMLAAQVVNEGTLQADRGSVALVAADRVTLDLGGLVGVTVERGSLAALVDNGGAIRADGGRVYLTARAADELASAAINHDGVIEARTLVTGEKGSIILLGDLEHGSLVADGRLDASAPAGGDGGFIETSAARVDIRDGAVITTRATDGSHGTWLLDPLYLDIVATGGVGSVSGMPATGTSLLSVGTLSTALNQNQNVVLEATNQIDFQVAFSHAATRDSVLTLLAPTIKLGGDITSTGFHLGLNFGGVLGATTYAGNLYVYSPVGAAGITRTLTTNGGNVVFGGNIGGPHNLVVDTGAGTVRLSANVDGAFNSFQQTFGDLAFRYQAGGRVGDTTTIDFTTSTVSFFDPRNSTTYQANQSELDAISGRPFSFPTGYLVIPANAIMDLNAQRVPIELTRHDGTIDTSLTSANNGEVTFPNVPTPISKLKFEQTNGSWTEILAVGISWMTNAPAGKLQNLTIRSSQVTVDASRTIAITGDLRIATAKFVNNAGSTALSVGTGKTWQVWSTNLDPFDGITGDVDGNLDFGFKYYGATFGVTNTLPGGGPLPALNGMFYSYRPNLAASLVNTVTKVYDGNATAINLRADNFAALTGAVDGDVVGFTGTLPTTGVYDSKNVGSSLGITSSVIPVANITAVSSTGKPVYGYGPSSLTATGYIGIITAKSITAVVGLTAQNKVYDGNTSATLNTGSATFTGMIAGDTLTVASATGTFVDKNVGTGKTVNISGLTLGGADLANYSLVSANATTTANITKLRLSSLSGLTAQNKVYDATTGATLDVSGASFGGLIGSDDLTITAGTGTFADKNVGTAKNVTVAGLTFGGADAGNYDLPLAAVTTSANITPKPITAVTGILADDKVYDGGTSAVLNTGSAVFAGLIGSDVLTVSSATGNFVDKNVGTGKTVNVTGLTLGGADLANYSLVSSNSTTTAAITKLRLTSLSGITAENKVYDRTTGATLDVSNASFGGLVSGDSLSITAGTGTFADRNVGTAKTVTVAGLTFGGNDAGNYDLPLSPVTTSANITPKPITAVTGILADDKVYDGNTSATLNSGSAVFAGVIAGDTLTVASATGNFVDKNVGTGKTVNVTGLTLGGADLANYSLVSSNSTTTANITKLRLTSLSGITAENKTYDRTTGATLDLTGATFGGLVGGDNLTLTGGTGAFADKNVGTAKTVTVAGLTFGGNDAGNYDLPLAPVTTTANITPKDITAVTGILADDKVYDAGTSATLNTGSAVFAGLIGGDVLTVSAATGNFVDKNVGTGKTVNVTGLTLGGADLANYNLVSSNSTTTANITPKPITAVTGILADDKVYDGNTSALLNTGSAVFAGLIGGDLLTVSSATGNFVDKNVGTGKTVNITGLTLGGADLANYSLVSSNSTTTANISKLRLSSLSGITAENKTYDRTTGATLDLTGATFGGLVGGDNLTLTAGTGTFADKNVGTGKTVTIGGLTFGGNDAGNYDLPLAPVTTTANITPKDITAVTGILALDKVYDGNTSATLDHSSAVFAGLIAGDTLTVASATGNFVNKNVGTGKTVNVTGLTLGGADLANYNLVSANSTTTASITKRTITGITGVTADGKVYDANPNATLNAGGAVFGGLVAGDTLTLDGATGLFSDPNAGNGKTVTISGYSLGGTDAGNYEYLPSSFSVLADITRAPLSVRAADLSKNHDGVPFAGGNGLIFTGFVGGQGQGVLTGSPTFGGNSQGAVNGGTFAITPGGFSSANYALTFVDGVLTIGAAPAAVDVRVFLPVPVLVPVLAVPPVAVRLPAAPGGLNYVPASRPAANVVAFAPSPAPATSTASVAAQATAAPAPAPAAEATVTEAAPAGPNGSRRAQDGVTRSLMGPLDVIVVNGGVNLGVRPVIAE
jgi:filamentous hemagglutinin family protein